MSYLSTLQSITGADLVAHWKCDDTGVTLQDSSGNNYGLTLDPPNGNGTKWQRQQGSLLPSDPSGRSIWFDGVSGHAYRTSTAAINNTSRTNYTLNVWCQVDSGGGITNADSTTLMGIKNKYQLNTRRARQFEFVLANSSNSYASRTDEADYTCNYSTRLGTINPANSYMLTMVWSVDTLTAYVNGQQAYLYYDGAVHPDRTISGYTDPAVNAAFGLANVGNNAAAGSYFNGWIQHASIVKRSLTSAEVRTLYQAGTARPVANSATVYPWPTTIVAANPSRKRVTIVNDSRKIVYLWLGGGQSYYGYYGWQFNAGLTLKPYGGAWTSDSYTGEINAVDYDYVSPATGTNDIGQGYHYLTVMEE